jgi:predicted transcriptional regulator
MTELVRTQTRMQHDKLARKDEAMKLLRDGLPPTEIAKRLHISTAAVMTYLCLKIGEGELRRSDIAFSLPREVRAAIEQAIEKTGSLNAAVVTRHMKRQGVNANRLDVGIYINYRRARVVLGDMYELIRTLELRLHSFVKDAFVAEFGEEDWWRSGIPDTIRAECAALREKDPEPAEDAFCYTHLINIREILDKRWPVLSKYMPKHLLNGKKDILERLLRLNRVRNTVMHPVRNAVLSEDEFEFVRDLEHDLGDLKVGAESVHEPAPVTEETAAAEGSSELVTKLAPVPDAMPDGTAAATAATDEIPASSNQSESDDAHDDFLPSVKTA